MAKEAGVEFESAHLGMIARYKFKGRHLVLLKPNTYMNRSGKAVNYWMQKEKLSHDRILIVLDDLNLSFGTLRLKGKGSDGGHNGLKDINGVLGNQSYPRLRAGIGREFNKGKQVDYVLGEWNSEEEGHLGEILGRIREGVHAYVSIGISRAMNEVNKKA